MKKVNFKNAFMAFAVALVFLLLGTVQSNAQVNPQLNATAVPQGTYQAPAQALNTLEVNSTNLKDVLSNLVPGTPLYNATLRLLLYYNGIATEITTGKSVVSAIEQGLVYLNDTNGNGNLNKSELMTLRSTAQSLLKI